MRPLSLTEVIVKSFGTFAVLLVVVVVVVVFVVEILCARTITLFECLILPLVS